MVAAGSELCSVAGGVHRVHDSENSATTGSFILLLYSLVDAAEHPYKPDVGQQPIL
jgi:hypothetical protein